MKNATRQSKVPVVVLPAGDLANADPLTPSASTASGEAAPAKLGRGKYPRDKSRARKPSKFPSVNPLFDLSGALKIKLLKWLRTIPHHDVILQMLEEEGVTGVLPRQLSDFYDFESQRQIEFRLSNAARDANALIRAVEKISPNFSPATLAALDQEIFRQISSGEAEPSAISKLGALFLKVQGHLRADEMHVLRSEKLRRELQGQIDHALEKLAQEVEKHPGLQGTFDALSLELANTFTRGEEEICENTE